jgi:hypothetical protein|tara:strand:+ start:1813 stop:3045 length:1233 start_codon:yes stop_codon:yes gene_type:complete
MPRLSTTLASFSPTTTAQSVKSGVFAARVKFAMVDDTQQNQVFLDFGEWSSIGCIFFDRLNQPNPNPQFTSDNFARPLFPNNSNIPLQNELVYIMALPNSNVQSDVNEVAYYYFQAINIWNSTHHNAIPDPIYGDANPESQQADYQQTEAGSVRRVTDGGTEINLGEDFSEKLEVRNLQPYTGDLIYQGRWGQTFRFGSTLQDANIPNPWSNAGEDGDPITIIKNGQHEEDTDPWVPQVEDINTDLSSIYLTSTQEIPIEVASKSYKSYDSSPEATPIFTGEQVIINSGRLLFNSKTDNILLSSFDTINLNSVNSVNIDTPKTIIQSPEVFLGDKGATEPIIFGDKFLKDFQSLMSSLISLCQALGTPIGSGPPFVINGAIPAPATETLVKAQTMLNKINDYKSKVSKTK